MLPPGESRKRKDRESTPAFYPAAKPSARLDYLHKPPPSTMPNTSSNNNGLLAGYFAYEFLTRGTILGEKFDPAKSTDAAVPLALPSRIRKGGAVPAAEEGRKKNKEDEEKSYAEVASLLKTERAHIPGIVNPTQLARWIRM
ncbi:unnamed protein product [Linum tenue]|uniref:Embryo sac development arrest 6 n=2 Tax=Linum tenue TaxID=586396 RepID=A0AAV0LSP7_9ROSI|nr:unnamed protein product [Linum tenue]